MYKKEQADIVIKEITSANQKFLFDMLYQAIFVPQGDAPPPPGIVYSDDLVQYAENWGRKGDIGFAALDSPTGKKIGAVWLRVFTENRPGYGFFDCETPELGIAVNKNHLGKGIGTKLLQHLIENLPAKVRQISLSVQKQNPAKRLYERFGFSVFRDCGDSVIMVLKIQD